MEIQPEVRSVSRTVAALDKSEEEVRGMLAAIFVTASSVSHYVFN